MNEDESHHKPPINSSDIYPRDYSMRASTDCSSRGEDDDSCQGAGFPHYFLSLCTSPSAPVSHAATHMGWCLDEWFLWNDQKDCFFNICNSCHHIRFLQSIYHLLFGVHLIISVLRVWICANSVYSQLGSNNLVFIVNRFQMVAENHLNLRTSYFYHYYLLLLSTSMPAGWLRKKMCAKCDILQVCFFPLLLQRCLCYWK